MSSDAFVSCAAAADASLAPASGSNSQKHSDDANDTGSHGESWKQAARDWSSTAAMQVSWAADLTHDLTRQLWLDTATVHRDMVAVQAGPRQQLCLVVNAWMLDRAKLESRRKQAQDEVQRVLAVLQRAQQQWAGHCAAMEAQLDLVRAEKQRLALEVAVLRARPSQPDPALSPSPTAPPAPAPPTGILGSTAPPAPAPPTGILGSAAPPAPPSAGRGPSAGLPPLPLHRPPRGSSNTTAMLSPSPIVDVQALDASLQGIRIRAHVAQRPTFAHAEPTSRPRIHQPMAAARKNSHQIRHAGPAARRARRWSPTSAPLYHHHHLPDDAAALRLRPHGGPRPPLSCSRTHQLLAANESRRLTLHAGHTPNHTLSSIPTMTDTAQDSTHWP
ncbi:hypothetical protein CDD82_2508 [Ophiocordyceps australis]|uniref:Uncharacterized protein n=1 Tax=Ophiocordyceps australis TaxID=1399860 RepID=A0A2C5XVB1_9HYPO|nr:hypothetical protein CDD82_2508 [Ophiocordyceps australis]